MMDVIDALNAGECVLIATDTVYGLAAVPSTPGYKRIFELKHRDSHQVLPWLVCSMQMMETLVEEVTPAARVLAAAFWPGGLTLILRASPAALSIGCLALDKSIALRMPDEPFALDLIAKLGKPLACTSANLHGCKAACAFEELEPSMAALPHDRSLPHCCKVGMASTIVDCTRQDATVIVREGAASKEQVDAVLAAASLLPSSRFC